MELGEPRTSELPELTQRRRPGDGTVPRRIVRLR
jgi:hypothetical protein